MAEQQTPTQHGLAWEYLAHSEVGLVRKNNQDSGLVSTRMLMVADGMGGAAAGDLASAVAVDTMIAIDHELAGPQAGDAETDNQSESDNGTESDNEAETDSEAGDRTDPLERLAGGISAANTRIADLVATDYSLEGMGTTATAVVLDGDDIGLAHIGDSRAYLFRDGELQQLTHDHSWVQSLIDDGKISESEAATHPHRSLLLKVLNGQPANEPDLSTVPLRPGDRLLLCSDGLCGFVEDEVIAGALTDSSRDDAMDQLVDAAHAAGGLDNITIILADLVERPETAAAPAAAATETPAATPPGTTEAGTARTVTAGTLSSAVLGAAAEHDLDADEEEIRQRVADREAGRTADDDSYDDDEDLDEGEDEDRYAPQAPSKRRWRRPLLLTLVVVLILGVAAGAGYAWTRTQYYVGAKNTEVAIFQGLSQSVPGIPLSRVYEVQDLELADLPAYYQGLVRATINTGSLDSARATVRQLRETAARCGTSGGSTPPSSPSPTAKSSPSKKTSPSKKSSPTKKSTKKPSKKSTSKSKSTAKPKATSKSTPKDTSKAKPTGTASTSATAGPSPTAGSSGQLPEGRC